MEAIGWFALVGQPYTYKFLWAPLMDRYAPPFLGRRRGWLLVTQLLLAAAIAFMGTLEPADSTWLLARPRLPWRSFRPRRTSCSTRCAPTGSSARSAARARRCRCSATGSRCWSRARAR